MEAEKPVDPEDDEPTEKERLLLRIIRRVHFGRVTVKIQDGRILESEATERSRFD